MYARQEVEAADRTGPSARLRAVRPPAATAEPQRSLAAAQVQPRRKARVAEVVKPLQPLRRRALVEEVAKALLPQRRARAAEVTKPLQPLRCRARVADLTKLLQPLRRRARVAQVPLIPSSATMLRPRRRAKKKTALRQESRPMLVLVPWKAMPVGSRSATSRRCSQATRGCRSS